MGEQQKRTSEYNKISYSLLDECKFTTSLYGANLRNQTKQRAFPQMLSHELYRISQRNRPEQTIPKKHTGEKIGRKESRVIDRTTPNPLVLYKYITCAALEGLLENGGIKVTYSSDANDPFEMLPHGYIPGTLSNSDIGFMSFTRNGNDPAMWGNYADKYMGARIRFEIPWLNECDEESEEGEEKARQLPQKQLDRIISTLAQLRERGVSAFYYEPDDGGIGAAFGSHFIFKCVYKKARYRKDSTESLTSDTQRQLKELEGKFLMVGTKHRAWRRESEYRVLISKELTEVTSPSTQEKASSLSHTPLTSSKRIQKIRLTRIFSKYITSITLAPRCPMDLHDANDRLQELKERSGDLRNDISINRANFKTDSFFLDIPDSVSVESVKISDFMDTCYCDDNK